MKGRMGFMKGRTGVLVDGARWFHEGARACVCVGGWVGWGRVVHDGHTVLALTAMHGVPCLLVDVNQGPAAAA